MLNKHFPSLGGGDSVGRTIESTHTVDRDRNPGQSNRTGIDNWKRSGSSEIYRVTNSASESLLNENRDMISGVLSVLSIHLEELLNKRFAELAPGRSGGLSVSGSWTDYLNKGRAENAPLVKSNDISAQVRALSEPLGNLGYIFDNPYRREVSCNAQILRNARNDWVHQGEFSSERAYQVSAAAVNLVSILGKGLSIKELEDFKRYALRNYCTQEFGGVSGTTQSTHGHFLPMENSGLEQLDSDVSDPVVTTAENPSKLTTLPAISWYHSGPSPYRTWVSRNVGTTADLDAMSRGTLRDVEAVIHEIVACEAPIHLDALKRALGKSYGISRVKGRRSEQLIKLIVDCDLHIDSDGFVWAEERDAITWSGFRARTSSPNFDEISPREIRNAYEYARDQHPDYVEGELEKSTFRLLGGQSMSRKSQVAIERALRADQAASIQA